MNGPNPQPQYVDHLRDHLRTRRNAVGLGLMLAGIVTFILFHFTKVEGGYGWEAWVELIDILSDNDFIEDAENLLACSGFITLTIGTLASPFLIKPIIHNPWIKWCLATFATMAAGIMWYFAADGSSILVLLLALSSTFTLAGLLCIRTIPRTRVPLDS